MAQFTNQASITYNGITANSNIVTGQITQVISVYKDATYGEYRAGDILTFVVSIQNSGTGDYNGLTITEDLGEYPLETTGTAVPLTYTGDPVLYYINGILQATPTVTPGPPLVINGISVPAGSSSVVIYRVSVNEYAPLGVGGEIESSVFLGEGGLSESISDVETVVANTDPFLSILKALNPTTVVENGQIVYTFTIENTGAVEADINSEIIISDTFDPPLAANPTVNLNGTPLVQAGNYSYDPVTGVFATVEGRITVPPATFIRNATTGAWSMTPGYTVLTVSGTI